MKQQQGRSHRGTNPALRMGGGIAVVLVLSAVAWVPAASAAPVAAGAAIASTGTGTEDHFTLGVLDPGDELSPSDLRVRTLDATRVNLSYTPDTGSGGSTNLVLTATINTTHAGWDLRGTNYASGNGAPCPGGITTAPGQRNVLVCTVGNTTSTTPVNFDPVMRISAAAGDNFAFHVTVNVSDTNTPNGVNAVSPDVVTSAAPRFDIEKTMDSPTQTANTMVNEGRYALKIGDTDPLGISALPDPVTFTDQVDAKARITRCYDSTPATFPAPPLSDPDTQFMEVDGNVTCNGAPFSLTPNTGLANGQANAVTMGNIDWERIYPPPTIPMNGISDASTGYVIAMMQFDLETDKTDIELGDGIANNGIGSLTVGNTIGMTGYDSINDVGVGPGVWNPVDTQGNPNLGSDDSPNPGEDDLTDNTATYNHNIYLEANQGKYISELTVDGQRVVTSLLAHDASHGVSWPTEMDMCDKFDNRREHLVRAPGSSEAVINATDPNAPPFAGATVQYARSAGWGPGAGSTGTQWWNMSQSGCRAADVVGGTFYTSSQVDWSNNNLGLIDAKDINLVRYLPNGPYLSPQSHLGTYYLNVYFQVADNNAGDFIVDYSSLDPDGPNGATGWDASSCNGGTVGSCPDPPELHLDNSNYRPGPVSSGVMLHIDSHPTIDKTVVNPPTASGTTPIDFTYELRLGNTRVPGDTTPRPAFTIRDVLPQHLDYQSGTFQVVSNPAGLTVMPVLPFPSIQGNSQVLTWTVSGLTLDTAPADMPVIQYVAKADVYTPSSGAAGYINRATLSGPGILDSQTTPWSPNSTITAAEFLGLSDVGLDGLDHSRWGLFDEARVVVNGSGRVIMDKGVDQVTGEPGDTFHYSLTYGNSGADVERMDAYDILPFDGDGARGSAMHGGIELLAATEDPNSDVDIWISDTDPGILDDLDAGTGDVPGGINATTTGLPGTATATWPCQIQQAGSTGCPNLSDVTAIRIVGADPNPAASGPADSFLPSGTGPFTIELTVRSVGGRGADELHNNWSAVFPPLGTPSTAAAPAHVLTEGAVGDRVYEDVNDNEIFDSGDHGIAGVEVTVFDSSNTAVGSTQTDANGRWLIDHLRPDDYRVRIPSTEFGSGGTLEAFEAAPHPAGDPDGDVDETSDHDAHPVANGIEAGGRVTLDYGLEPLLDDLGSLTFLRDADSNLTVDFAVVRTSIIEPPTTTTTTPATTTTMVGQPPKRHAPPPRGSLPRTGWASLLWILIGGSLVLGGAMVVSRRQDRRA